MESFALNKLKINLEMLNLENHYCSTSDVDDAEQEAFPKEKSITSLLVRRTVDLKSLYLTKSDQKRVSFSPMTPFGPKTSARLIPAKNFDNAEIELDVLENYHIWSDIGRGTYAVVKFATQRSSGLKVALKIYEKSKIQEPIRQKGIKREIKIMKQLSHPNIAYLIEDINSEKNLYLVMEYVQGVSLQGFITKKPWKRAEEKEAALIFTQVIQALAYCHSKKISHRDIKLENILLDKNLQVKIIDFGFATCNTKEKKSYIYCGTPNYMAPEIVRKEEYLGEPVDIWAAGVLLYILVTGGFPFSSNKESKVFKKVASGEYVLPDYLSQSCKDLINRMLDKNPATRITAKEILQQEWVLEKGSSGDHQPPHKGDNIDVSFDDDVIN